MSKQQPIATGNILHSGISGTKRASEISFDDLIAPLAPKTFFDEYWEKQPLISRARPADFFKPLFAIADMDRAICYFKPKPGRIDLVTEEGFVRDNFLGSDGTANINLVMESYLKGSTVVLSGLEQTWEPLVSFSRALEACLNHPIAMAVYLSPPNFHGVKPHYDTQENFLLQVEGTKQWKVYPPLNELPPVEGSYAPVSRDRLSEPICEAVLEPGDVIYIPRGFVHEGMAEGKPSLHITIDVHVRTWYDFLHDALAAMAERAPEFRRSLPAGFLNDEATMQSLAADFGQFMEIFQRKASYKDAVGKHTETLAVRTPPPPDGHFSLLNAEILADTRLKKRRTTVARVVRENGVAGIQFSGNQVFGPAKIYEALRHIADTEVITPASLPGALNDNEKLILVRRLLRTGLLTLA